MASQQDDLLVEIGTEELPPKPLFRLAETFSQKIKQELEIIELPFEHIEFYATPRRISVLVRRVASQQKDRILEKVGPAVALAFDKEGNLTPAAIGFAKACRMPVKDLQTKETPKGLCLYSKQIISGESIIALAPDFVKKALNQLPIPKSMLWGNHSVPFLRPVHWLLMLYGEEVIPCELFELSSTNKTYGHRFHAPSAIHIKKPSTYSSLLEEKGFVIASYQKRKAIIQQQIENVSKTKGQVIIDEDLLDEVTSLVEWPTALLGCFDSRFLQVPQEALISAMKYHQKCFPIVNAHGYLLPYFITVSNIDSKDPQQVIIGNERVIRARLSDAEFFYYTDLKRGLERHLNELKTIVFQNKLGTLYEKAERITELAGTLGEMGNVDINKVRRASLLCKADLATEMVGEFPELQGTMGFYYALKNNESVEVALAIKEHYLPRFAGDSVPSEIMGSLVALADKTDTLVGIFGINQVPSGEKDPFGLRRAALGIVRILIENRLSFDLRELLEIAIEGYPKLENDHVLEMTLRFIMERLRAWYIEKGIDADVFASVFARYPTSPLDFEERIRAVHYFKQLPEAKALSAANKRVGNILKQTPIPLDLHFKPSLFQLEAERQLGQLIEQETKTIKVLCAAYKYQEALTLLAKLRQPVDRFFEEVMVMTDDEGLRHNRLVLLNNLRQLFLQIADISLLQ
jgi:glycyl-tRNA synthetase beta chain